MTKCTYIYSTAYDSRRVKRTHLGDTVRISPLSRTSLLINVVNGSNIQKVRRIPGIRKIVMQLEVDDDLCRGCSNCVSACPANSLDELIKNWDEPPTSEKYVLRIKNGTLSANRLDKCRRVTGDKSCETCMLACPYGAISIKS